MDSPSGDSPDEPRLTTLAETPARADEITQRLPSNSIAEALQTGVNRLDRKPEQSANG